MTIVDSYFRLRYSVFKQRTELSFVYKLVLAFGIAIITGFMAQIKIFLPWSPIPITCQTFAVLLSGVLLGGGWGAISQVIYIALGAAGIPWFGTATVGVTSLAGPTGGYIIGFVLAAWFIGHFSDKYAKTRNFGPMLGLMLFANFVLIYIPGLLQLELWMHFVKGSTPTLWELLTLGAMPFVAGDIAKILAATALVKAITPKDDFLA
jgi:biotin transport system substrate-specific component